MCFIYQFRKLVACCILLLCAIGTHAQQTLYAVSGDSWSTSTLYTLDPATGALNSTLGSTGYSYITSMAVNPITGIIYAHSNNNGGTLLTLSPVNGAATFVGYTSIQATDMTFSPSGVLYAWNENDDNLYTIDVSSGSATQMGSCFCWSSYPGLACSSSGQLYKSGSGYLHTISSTTGQSSSSVFLSNTVQDILAFNSTGTLYGGQRSGSTFTLKTINLSNGGVSTVGTSNISNISAIAFGGTLPACTGAPEAGTVSAPASACPNAPFTLTATGLIAASGINYQWQSSAAGQNIWTNISGATLPAYTVANQTASTDYRLYAVCTPSTLSDTSNIVSVTQNNFSSCYCSPNNGNPLVYWPNNTISNVTISGTTLNSSNIVLPASGYTQVAATPASNTASMNITYTYSITISTVNYFEDVDLWIDYNQNGTFDATEKIGTTINWNNTQDTARATFTIPATALPGNTGMRITSSSYSGISGSCDIIDEGEVEDYTITLVQLPACSGAPVAGTAVASTPSTCASNSFVLTLAGNAAATGLTYQWQSKPISGTTWTNISGATNMIATVSGQTQPTEYRAVVSCGTSSSNSVSDTVNQNLYSTCYCSPLNGTPLVDYWGNYIDHVTILNTTLNSSGHYTSGGYTQVAATPASNTASMNITYPYTIRVGNPGFGYDEVAVWIDYNQDGVFATTEKTLLSPTPNWDTAVGTFIIPSTALPGATGMRVTWAAYGSTANSCDMIWEGEVEDYTVTLVQLPACSGAPAAGATISNISDVCTGVSIDLSLTGVSMVSGLTYQWQSKPVSSTTWTNISGATNMTYTVASQSVSTEYRAVISCGTNSSNSVATTVNQNSFYLCYCSPLNGNPLVYYSNNYISNVNIPTTTLSSSNTLLPVNGYSQIPATPSYNTASLNIGYQYTINVEIPNSWSVDNAAAWIDYNQNSSLDANEFVQMTFDYNTYTATGSFTVPTSALAGSTGMRIFASEYTLYNYNACDVVYSGEVEDYVITLVQLPACSGTPNAGTANASKTSVCTDEAFTLSVTGATTASGLSYQWQKKLTTATTWSNVSGATGMSYNVTTQSAATDYRVVVSCGSNNANSTTVTVDQNDFLQCYCNPANGTVFVNWGNNYVTNFSASGTTLNHYTSTTPSNGYLLVPASPAANTGTFEANQSYTFTATLSYPYLDEVAVWIDYNQNGTFELSEKKTLNIVNYTAAGNIIIPATALSGNTGLRVTASGDGILNSSCAYFYDGEVQDYTVTINGTCNAPTLYAVSGLTANAATFGWQSVSAANHYEYVVSQNSSLPTGAGTSVTGTTHTETGLMSNTTYYFYLRSQCGNNGLYSEWSSQMFSTLPTSVGSVNATDFSVIAAPNPAKDRVVVKVNGTMAAQPVIRVQDITGKVLQIISASGKETMVSLDGLAAGVYFIHYSDKEHMDIIKIVKE